MVTKSFVSLSDIHYPYQDKDAEVLVTKFLKDFQPDILVFNGDIFDMPTISKYNPRRLEVVREMPLQKHLDIGVAGMSKLIDAANPREVKFALGNHEDRWELYLGTKAKELSSLRALDMEQVFQLGGIDWCHYGQGFRLNNNLFVYHGEALGAGWTDKERQKAGASTITGHQHKQGVSYHRDRTRAYKNVGQGCLCSLNPPYLRTPPNWQQGFVYGYIHDDDKFRMIEVEIVQGEDDVWMSPERKLYRVGRKASGSPAQTPTRVRQKS